MHEPNHSGFGYTEHGHYACFCGYPVSEPTPPIPANFTTAQLIHAMKQRWYTHKLRATNRSN